MGLLPKLIFKLSEPDVTVQKVEIISGVITSLLKAHFTPQDISRYDLRIYNIYINRSGFQIDILDHLAVLGVRYIFIKISVLYVVRLGLYLVYTIPPLSTTNQDNTCEFDLSHDTPGTIYNTQPHCIQSITCLMYESCFRYSSKLLCVLAQSSDPANLIWIRNQMLLTLSEILNQDSLLVNK